MKTTTLSLILAFPTAIFTGCSKPATETAGTNQEPASDVLQLGADSLANAALSYAEAAPAEIGQRLQAFGETALDTGLVESVPARTDGIIAADSAQLGDAVAPGQILATIESPALASAIVTYLQTSRDLQFTRSELAREKELFDKKLASSESYFTKQQEFDKAQIAHAAAFQPLALLDFNEGQLAGYIDSPGTTDLTRYEVRSPRAGVVTKKNLIKGESVTSDRELFVVADLSQVWVDFRVPLADAGLLKPGQDVTIGMSTAPNAPGATAELRYIAPLANGMNRTVEARAVLPNPGGKWRPGTPVTVGFTSASQSYPVTVPSPALLDVEGTTAVFVRQGDAAFALREVTPGPGDGSRTAITAGLAAGETVVTEGAFQLKALRGMGAEG